MNLFCGNRVIGCGLWIAAATVGLPSAFAAPEAPAEGVSFLSGFSGMGRLGFFRNQRDELQEERYVNEGAMTLDFDLVSFRERWSFRSRFDIVANMGTSVADNLPFSPKDMTYEIIPYLEYQGDARLYRLGWNHACQHLIYKDNEAPWYTLEGSNVPPDVYYNRLFLGAGRREIRPEILWRTFFREDAIPPRVLWYLEAGGYLRSLPGMDADSLYGYNDWIADALAEIRLLLFAANRWLLFATSRTQVLLDAADEIYARELVQMEAVFDSRGFGSTVYLGGHVVDEHPRDSKEGLVEVGGKFYF